MNKQQIKEIMKQLFRLVNQYATSDLKKITRKIPKVVLWLTFPVWLVVYSVLWFIALAVAIYWVYRGFHPKKKKK